MTRNICVDNLIKCSLPKTWNAAKEHPHERVLSLLASITNTHISIFLSQIFRRNLIETGMMPDSEGNSKNDRYRASKMKINEEYVITSSMDMAQLVEMLFEPFKEDITPEEIAYYRKNMKPSRLQQLMIEIYFFNYTGSSAEFTLLRNLDWFKLLLIMRRDIMKRFNVNKDSLLDSTLTLILTSNIEETPVGEKVYIKDTKYLNNDPDYKLLVEKYYSTIVDMNEDIIKKFLIGFLNAKYRAVVYEYPNILDTELIINKKDLASELMNFLILANSTITLENMVSGD